jgi:hypothetical protein
MRDFVSLFIDSKGRKYRVGMTCVIVGALIVWASGLFLVLEIN